MNPRILGLGAAWRSKTLSLSEKSKSGPFAQAPICLRRHSETNCQTSGIN